jgi:hypothetical protein
MNTEKKPMYRWFIWAGLILMGAATGFTVAMFWRPSRPNQITVSMDTNGTTHVAGVPLSDTNLRNGAFTVMGALGVKARLEMPDTSTNRALESNVIETLKRMTRAGLFSTNPPPNPHE